LLEIAKNIIWLMLDLNGFEVRDLGSDVDLLRFIKEAKARGVESASQVDIKKIAFLLSENPDQ
jgi:methanogenic corrinoid protein MtbC1